MDQAILHYIRLRHGLLLGEKTVEELKIKLGSAYEKPKKKKKDDFEKALKDDENKMAIVRGRDLETGLPKSLRVTEVEVREALAPVVAKIVESVAEVLEEAPPELTADILENGILLTGGGSLLYGLDRLIVERTHIPVIRSEDPLTTVVRGTGKVLEDEELLNRVKVIGGLK
jgi:rod shape-determining protein MreB and related proteins